MKPRLPACLLLMTLLLAGAPGSLRAEVDAAPPLPERNPARVPAPAIAKPILPSEVPTIPWTAAEISDAKAKCTQLLAEAAFDYQPREPIKEGICGAPAPILLKSIGKDPAVEIDPPATLTCPVAAALATWLKDVVQPDAHALIGSPVVKLHNATSYACRNRYGAAEGPLSEHALANALDVSAFIFASGEQVTVLESWPQGPLLPPLPLPNPTRAVQATASVPSTVSFTPKSAGARIVEVAKVKPGALPSPPPLATPPAPLPASDKKGEFVKQVHDDACRTFGTVLGPAANAAHKNHFHLDMKERRSGFCE